MTVKELIEELKKEDGDRIVVLQKDAEGNGYSPYEECYTAAYVAETTWYGEVGLEELTDDFRQQGYGEEDVLDGQPALILRPVN